MFGNCDKTDGGQFWYRVWQRSGTRLGMKYTYAHTITQQYILASGAFQIENPDKAADAKATELAALESVLKTYQAILKQKPDAKAKPLNDLLKKQSQR